MAPPPPPASSLLALVPALLLILLVAPTAASSSRRPSGSALATFPAGLAPPRRAVSAPAADGSGNATAAVAKPFTAHYFPQELDHFTFTSNSSRVFQQKYLLNDTFWRKPTAALSGGRDAGPLFVYTGPLLSAVLASWFRLKYPHVAMGALASSAPILQFDDITPWTSFYDAVSLDFKSESLNCFSVIKSVWDVLAARGSNATGLLEPSKTFRACKTVQSVGSLSGWLSAAFTYTAMMDYPTPADFMENMPAYPVKEMCKIIDAFPAGADVVDKAFAAASLYYNYTGDQKCFQVEGDDDPHGLSGWDWQSCTEMVMPMTVSNESMFPPSSYSYKEDSKACFERYGVRLRPHWITTEFGGTKIYQVLKRFGSNIIFSNGMCDPWSRGGVLKNISSNIIALVTEKGAHHLDLRSATKEDPDWVVEQRRQEVEIIRGWIDQYNQDIEQMSQ